MTQQLEQRLKELQEEFEAGQKLLAEYEAKQINLRSTLLRISGAIQVLEEILEAKQVEALQPLMPDNGAVQFVTPK